MVALSVNRLQMFAGTMAKKKHTPKKEKKEKRRDVGLIALVNLSIKLLREAGKLSQKDFDIVTKLNSAKYECGTKEMTVTTIGIYAKYLNTEPFLFFLTAKQRELAIPLMPLFMQPIEQNETIMNRINSARLEVTPNNAA